MTWRALFILRLQLALESEPVPPSLPLPVQDKLSEKDKYNIQFAPNMALNGLLAPFLVYPALTRTPPLAANGKFAMLVEPRHPASALGCAATVGYMAGGVIDIDNTHSTDAVFRCTESARLYAYMCIHPEGTYL